MILFTNLAVLLAILLPLRLAKKCAIAVAILLSPFHSGGLEIKCKKNPGKSFSGCWLRLS